MEGLTMVAQMLHPANILRSCVLPRGEKLGQKASRLSRRRYFRSRLARLVSSYLSTSSRSFSRGWTGCLTGTSRSIDINVRKGELPATLLYNVRCEA
jgi:hypothetical protein